MNRITNTLQVLRNEKKTWIIPYVTPEFPVPGTTVPLVLSLEKAGATMVEIGIPFSDPLADGPTIQHSSEIAIRNGVNIPKIFEIVREIRAASQIPIIAMGYMNPILNYGIEQFFSDGKKAGIDGVIIPDLPPEESGDVSLSCKTHGVSIIYLIAPTSSDERIKYIDGKSTDFSYCVSVTGVTGVRQTMSDTVDEFLLRVKKNVVKPYVVGFGIKNKEHVQRVAKNANGVVIGSALIEAIGKETDRDAVVKKGSDFLTSVI